MIDEEVDRINDAIVKRERAKKKGNEAEVEAIEKMLEKEGFEIEETDDIVAVKRKKKANI